MPDFLIPPEEEDFDCDEEIVFAHMSRINENLIPRYGIVIKLCFLSCKFTSSAQFFHVGTFKVSVVAYRGKCNLLLSRRNRQTTKQVGRLSGAHFIIGIFLGGCWSFTESHFSPFPIPWPLFTARLLIFQQNQ